MIKFSSSREMTEELVRIHNEIGKLDVYAKNIDSLQRDLYKMGKEIKKNQEKMLKSQNISQVDNNEAPYVLLNESTFKSEISKFIETKAYKYWLNDFEVSMVEKALNITLYPWQKEFLKGSNCVNINRASGKTFIFTLAYTLKLISLEQFVNYDVDVHRVFLTPVYHNTERIVGEMFLAFHKKLSVYPFDLNTSLKLTKEWRI